MKYSREASEGMVVTTIRLLLQGGASGQLMEWDSFWVGGWGRGRLWWALGKRQS